MNYGELNTPMLRELAEQEAEQFSVPLDYLRNQTLVEGLAIDTPYPSDHDDAISLSDHNGKRTLHVSISDVGTFIEPDSALQKYALRRLYTIYKDNTAIIPMVPPEISEDSLSLLDGQPRPVITFHIPVGDGGNLGEASITHDTLVAQSLTPQEVNERLRGESMGGQFSELAIVTRALFRARHTERQLAALEDERGQRLFLENDMGSFIVQESMIAANTAMARYFQKYDIPGLYRIHELTPEQHDAVKARPELARLITQARYSIRAGDHVGLNLTGGYMHATSPIRRYADLANHINLAAHLDGRNYPFTRAHLAYVASRMARIEAQKHGEQTSMDFDGALRTKQRAARSIPNREKITPSTDHLLAKIASGTINDADLTQALFGTFSDTDTKIQALREAAAGVVAREVSVARSILQIITARGIIRLEPVENEETDVLKLMATEARGNSFPYELTKRPTRDYLNTARLIGQLAGIEIKPVAPERMTIKGKIMRRPFEYLCRLDQEKRDLFFRYHHTIDEASGTVTLEVRFTLNGKRRTRIASGNSKNAVERSLCGKIIQEFDLIRNPPPVRPTDLHSQYEQKGQKKAPGDDLQTNPVSILAIHAARSHAPKPVYANTTAGDADQPGDKECTMTFMNVDGELQDIVAHAGSYQAAKNVAAAIALEMLPPVSPKPKKRTNPVNVSNTMET